MARPIGLCVLVTALVVTFVPCETNASRVSFQSEREQALIDTALRWVDVRERLRSDTSIGGLSECFAFEQRAVVLPSEAELADRCLERDSWRDREETATLELAELVRELNPNVSSALKAERFVVDLMQRFRPESGQSVKFEFDFLSNQERMLVIQRALDDSRNDNGRYPRALDDVLVYLATPELLFDTWDRRVIYRQTEPGTYVLYSPGPNGIDDDGRGDDVPSLPF